MLFGVDSQLPIAKTGCVVTDIMSYFGLSIRRFRPERANQDMVAH